MKTDEKIRLYPDQLRSLSELRPLLKPNRRAVLDAIIKFKEQDDSKSYATHDQIHEVTGLSYRTISRCITEFRNAGLLRQWQITNGSWCRYLILPVADRVFQFYGKNRKKNSLPKDKTLGLKEETLDPEKETKTVKAKILDSREETLDSKEEMDPEMSSSLDPKISALIDELETTQDPDNPAVEYLTSQGMVQYLIEHGSAVFQIASGLRMKIDRDELLRFLRRWSINSFPAFMRVVDKFSQAPENYPPRIDLPMEEDHREVHLKRWLQHKLADHSSGFFWVWDHIKTGSCDDPVGYMPFEEEYRESFITFMRKYRLRTLDDVIKKAVEMDAEIEAARETADQK
jgi:hypothetical protein